MDSKQKIMDIEEQLCIKASNNRIPLTANFELTPICNMNCEMCYIRLSSEEQVRIQSLRTISEWIALAKKLKQLGTLFILLTGGEPLTYPGFLELYQELKKMGFIITINTNGTLFTEEIVNVLEQDMPRRVNITIYGANNNTYLKVTGNKNGYDQTIRGIQLLRERNIPIKLNGSMVRANAEDTPLILELADTLHIPVEYNTYMFPCSYRKNLLFPENVRLSPDEAARWDIYIKKHQEKKTVFIFEK